MFPTTISICTEIDVCTTADGQDWHPITQLTHVQTCTHHPLITSTTLLMELIKWVGWGEGNGLGWLMGTK